MTENSIVVSQHGLSDSDLREWFNAKVCEVAHCCPVLWDGSSEDSRLVELYLENELEIAEHTFSSAFPAAFVRRALPTDKVTHSPLPDNQEEIVATQDAAAREENAIIQHCFGSDSEFDANGIQVMLSLRCGIGGGTGARLWSGGILMAEWLARGAPMIPSGGSQAEAFTVKENDVLELGAGSAALPSIVAARRGARKVVASDLLADVVSAMRENVSKNEPSVSTILLDWLPAGRTSYATEKQYDVILFADAIYTERGAFLLADAIKSLLRPGGFVVGSLPDFRVGISSFESDLRFCGYIESQALLDSDIRKAAARPILACNGAGVIAGGSVEGYRILIWQRPKEADSVAQVSSRRGKPRKPRRGQSSE